MFKTVGHIWKPTGRTFTLVGDVCPLTRIDTINIVPPKEPSPIVHTTDKPVVTLVYSRKPKAANKKVPSLVANKMEPNRQFCDSDLEVSFRQHTCFILNLDGVDLLTGSRGNNLYTLSLQDMMASSPICLLSKASKTKSWLCVNEKKYILVIVDDYSRFTWVKLLRTKDETPDFIIKFLKMIQTLYELLHSKLPDLSFFYVFGALCYPTNDSEKLGKLQTKADIEIFIGYAPSKKAFRIYNRRTRRIVETIHVNFDELTTMASKQSSSGPALNDMTPGTISSGLVLDQDAPSPSKSLTTTENQSSVIPQDVGDDNLDMEVAHMGNDLLLGVPIPEVTSVQSLSTASPQSS
nr:copia protein [Tanacetum cinerariifolium]